MMAVCFAERAIYELSDEDLTPERILQVIRREESRLLFLPGGSPRPVLSIPHLLAGESSAYYHGYVLAQVAVAQTRRFFLDRDGHLVDNPKIGPALREAYWRPGNSKSFSAFLEALTGNPLSAAALVQHVTRSVEQAMAEAEASVAHLASVPPHTDPVDLNAFIAIHHGKEVVATLSPGGDFNEFSSVFSNWIAAQVSAK
mmetsp:Transcript_65174/g.153899  ORF Transcript_65174/g.153899 Transcript_65174/m.153899 type:complete len:200 (-) Transcript_65174:40-639(-)